MQRRASRHPKGCSSKQHSLHMSNVHDHLQAWEQEPGMPLLQ